VDDIRLVGIGRKALHLDRMLAQRPEHGYRFTDFASVAVTASAQNHGDSLVLRGHGESFRSTKGLPRHRNHRKLSGAEPASDPPNVLAPRDVPDASGQRNRPRNTPP